MKPGPSEIEKTFTREIVKALNLRLARVGCRVSDVRSSPNDAPQWYISRCRDCAEVIHWGDTLEEIHRTTIALERFVHEFFPGVDFSDPDC